MFGTNIKILRNSR